MKLDADTFLFIAGAVAVGIIAANVTIAATVWGVGLCVRFGVWMDGPAINPYKVEREEAEQVRKAENQ